MEDRFATFLRSIMGGVLIALGGTCYLSVDNKILGAFLFSMGLLSICCTGQYLFTGKCSYESDIRFLLMILLGNVIGSCGMGIIIHALLPGVVPRAVDMCQTKMAESFRLIPLGIFCNILIYFAVEGYKNGQTILLIMCVMAFILCGFEHCVANMYYFSVAFQFSLMNILWLIVNVLSNWIGGLLILLSRKRVC